MVAAGSSGRAAARAHRLCAAIDARNARCSRDRSGCRLTHAAARASPATAPSEAPPGAQRAGRGMTKDSARSPSPDFRGELGVEAPELDHRRQRGLGDLRPRPRPGAHGPRADHRSRRRARAARTRASTRARRGSGVNTANARRASPAARWASASATVQRSASHRAVVGSGWWPGGSVGGRSAAVRRGPARLSGWPPARWPAAGPPPATDRGSWYRHGSCDRDADRPRPVHRVPGAPTRRPVGRTRLRPRLRRPVGFATPRPRAGRRREVTAQSLQPGQQAEALGGRDHVRLRTCCTPDRPARRPPRRG